MDTYVGKQGKSKKNSSGWKMEMQNEQRPIRKREKIQSKRFIFQLPTPDARHNSK